MYNKRKTVGPVPTLLVHLFSCQKQILNFFFFIERVCVYYHWERIERDGKRKEPEDQHNNWCGKIKDLAPTPKSNKEEDPHPYRKIVSTPFFFSINKKNFFLDFSSPHDYSTCLFFILEGSCCKKKKVVDTTNTRWSLSSSNRGYKKK